MKSAQCTTTDIRAFPQICDRAPGNSNGLWSTFSRLAAASVALTVFLGLHCAHAQQPASPAASLGINAQGIAPGAEPTMDLPPFMMNRWGMDGITPKDCKYYDDQLGYRGFVTLMSPPACGTVYPSLLGLRPTLADLGIGFQDQLMFTYSYDLRGNNKTPQQYGGQKPTVAYSQLLQFTYDLSRIGFTKDAQLSMEGIWQASNFSLANPYILGIANLSVDQPLLNGALDLRYGLITLATNYYGLAIGGIAFGNAQGPISIIPHEVGLAFETGTPTVEAIVRPFPGRQWYDNFSFSEATGKNEVDDNPHGITVRIDGARALVANELGYGGAQDATWFRFGSIYNFTPQMLYKNGQMARGNYDLYAGITYQLTGRGNINHGLFVDLKGDYAPQDRNFYANDVSLTLSYRGVARIRPLDTFSLGFQYLSYSRDLRTTLMHIEHQGLPSNSNSFSASYAAFVRRGLFLISTLSYLTQPVGVTQSSPGALTISESIALAL